MAIIDKIKEKLSKENPVESTSTSEMYSNKPFVFEVKIHEEDLKTMLRSLASGYNKKHPDKEITISDVFNVILKKALLEHRLLYPNGETYFRLVKEVEALTLANYKVNYFMNHYLTKMEEEEALKNDMEAIKKIVNKEED